MNKILIIGGSNIDIISRSINPIINNDSNPGNTFISPGGVSRNISENLSLLKIPHNFITAIGNDDFGNIIINRTKSKYCNLISPSINKSSSSYTAILDNNGDMVNAICDNSIIDYIDIDFMNNYNDLFIESEYIILDLNLSQESIDYIFNKYSDKKIIVDATSSSKTIKIINHIDNIYLLKVNNIENNILSKTNLNPIYKLITDGPNPITLINYKDNSSIKLNPIKKDKITNVTGAGDALLAGLVASIYNNKSINDSLLFGLKCSSITLDSNQAVNKDIAKLKI